MEALFCDPYSLEMVVIQFHYRQLIMKGEVALKIKHLCLLEISTCNLSRAVRTNKGLLKVGLVEASEAPVRIPLVGDLSHLIG